MAGKCENCAIVEEFGYYNQYTPACAYCGARLIQKIRSYSRVPAEERSARCKKVLADWVAWGHKESLIRDLVARNELIEPGATGKRR